MFYRQHQAILFLKRKNHTHTHTPTHLPGITYNVERERERAVIHSVELRYSLNNYYIIIIIIIIIIIVHVVLDHFK